MANLKALAARLRQHGTDWAMVRRLLKEALSDSRFLVEYRPITWLDGEVYDDDAAAEHVALLCYNLASRRDDFPTWPDFDWRQGYSPQHFHPLIANPNGDASRWNLSNEQLFRAREVFESKKAEFTEALAQLLESYSDEFDKQEGPNAPNNAQVGPAKPKGDKEGRPDGLDAFYAEIYAFEDDHFDQTSDGRMHGTSVWFQAEDKLREIEQRHGVSPRDPRVYTIATYLEEKRRIEQEFRELCRQHGWPPDDPEDADYHRACHRKSARLDDLNARHFGRIEPVGSPHRLWAYIHHTALPHAEMNHTGLADVYFTMLKLKLPSAPEPPYPDISIGQEKDKLLAIANGIEFLDARFDDIGATAEDRIRLFERLTPKSIASDFDREARVLGYERPPGGIAKTKKASLGKNDAPNSQLDDDVDQILADVQREREQKLQQRQRETDEINRRTRMRNAFNSAVATAIHVTGFLRDCGEPPGTDGIPEHRIDQFRDWQTKHLVLLGEFLRDEGWIGQLDRLSDEGPPERRVAVEIVRAAAAGDRTRVKELFRQLPPRGPDDIRDGFTTRVYIWLKDKICHELDMADTPGGSLVAPVPSSEDAQRQESLLPQDGLTEDAQHNKKQSPNVRAAEKAKPKPKKEKRIEWLARAMLLVQDRPEWSDAEIARRVAKDKSTLSRSKEYQAAAAIARAEKGAKANIPKGHQTKSDNGLLDVDAISSEDDPAEMDWDN